MSRHLQQTYITYYLNISINSSKVKLIYIYNKYINVLYKGENFKMAWSGSGTLSDPYLISTVDELIETTGSTQHYYYKLVNDLDLSAYNPWQTLVNDASNGLWIGSLDGNNKKISNLILNENSAINVFIPPFIHYDYIGLFGYLVISSSENAFIKNLIIDKCKLTLHNHDASNNTFIGVLAARNQDRLIENVHITNFSASILISPTDGFKYKIGGIVGVDERFSKNVTSITSCSVQYATASISASSDTYDNYHIFSFIANEIGSSCTHSFNYIKDCYGFSNFIDTSDVPISDNIIAAYSNFISINAKISNCYILNLFLTSSNRIVGFSAETFASAKISNIYSSIKVGNTDPDNVYPFCSDYYHLPTFSKCYYESGSYDFDGNDQSYFAGLTGSLSSSMKNQSNYLDWDFNNIWTISPSVNDGYPYFLKDIIIATNPTFTILTPNGGETYIYNQLIPISWSFSL